MDVAPRGVSGWWCPWASQRGRPRSVLLVDTRADVLPFEIGDPVGQLQVEICHEVRAARNAVRSPSKSESHPAP